MAFTAQDVKDTAQPSVERLWTARRCGPQNGTPASFYGRKQRGREVRATRTDEILSLYQSGKSTDAIGASLGVSGGLIKRIIRENGGHIKSTSEWQRKHALDERFFQTIDTEEKAYCLGFMFADGNVSTAKGTITMTQKEEDADVLAKIAKCMGSESPIHRYVDKRTDYKRSATAHFSVGSMAMCADLITHGCVPNKTFVTKFPFDSITPHLYRHFVRGYFDGDGCIPYSKGKPDLGISIVGTEELLQGIHCAFESSHGQAPCSILARHPERNHNIRTLRLRKQVDSISFMKWMYEGAAIFMDRKYARYLASVGFYENRKTKCSQRTT